MLAAAIGALLGTAQAQVTTCEVVEAVRPPDTEKVKALTVQAQAGAAQSQYALGCLYRWGKGVQKDFRIALEWFMRAADQDDPAARHEIADMYRYHGGQKGEMRRAFEMLKEQAQAGDARAQFSLGMMYVNGLGVETNDAAAVFWYEKSAAQDNVEAKGRLAGMYARGRGVKQDYAKALERACQKFCVI